MKFERASSDKWEDKLERYRQLSMADIERIQPRWACGANADKLMDFSQHPTLKRYTVYLVDTQELIDKTEFYDFDVNKLFTGDDASDSRVANTLDHWKNECFIDPPIVTLYQRDSNKLLVSDGRHRTKINYLLGYKKTPIAIHNTSTHIIKELIHLQPM